MPTYKNTLASFVCSHYVVVLTLREFSEECVELFEAGFHALVGA